MPYCPECGKELSEDVAFCPHCGAHLREPRMTYRRPRGGLPIIQIISIFFGGVIVIAGLGILMGGTAVTWVQRGFSDADGFITSRDVRFYSDSYAFIIRELNIEIDDNIPDYFWRPRPSDFITVRLVGTSNDLSKEAFIGIAREADARMYLGDVEYDTVSDFDWDFNPQRETHPQIQYNLHQGTAPSGPPTLHSFWVAHATGLGTQTLRWEPTSGSFWIIVMNADGSKGVDLDMRFGAKVPVLRTVGNGLIAGGLITLAIGGLIIYYGALRRH
jgi:hypothetical protein